MSKKKRKSFKRHNWTPEEEAELKTAFSALVEKTKKLPTLKIIPRLIIKCETLYPLFQNGTITESSIKNKLDRLFLITNK